MLTHLTIENIAVIEKMEVEFRSGFNVLTGETAAGKSIIIDAINMALGGRVSRDLIRAGSDKAVVQAVFATDREGSEDGAIIVRREVCADGRGVCKVNGEFVTASLLREITENLVNIHGQHDNQALLNPARHIDILDEFAGCLQERLDYREVLARYREIEKQITGLQMDEQMKAQKLDMLRFQVGEINAVNPKDGEDAELAQMRDRLANSEKIMSAMNEVYGALYAGETAAVDVLAFSARKMMEAGNVDEKAAEFANQIEEAKIVLDDVSHQISDYIGKFEASGVNLDEIESRLHAIFQLKRKYGAEISDILAHKQNVESEIASLESGDEQIENLNKELVEMERVLEQKARVLTAKRESAAKILREKVAKELADLEMTKVRFDVLIKSVDAAEFLIATNSGEGLKPLAKIASGGELSRISLAIKSILADTDTTGTLIFDEIDSGISGRAAQKTAEKMAKIGKTKQILCITHLAQIAGMASNHFRISKEVQGGRTFAKMVLLDGTGREQELARIIGGAQITELTLKNAREMLQLAEEVKV